MPDYRDTGLIDFGYDYITLTSFDREMMYVGRDIAMQNAHYHSPGKPQRMLGYGGNAIDGMFYGSRRQLLNGVWREHFMAQMWGQYALDRALVYLDHVPELHCTRLDVQATVSTQLSEALRDTYDKAKQVGLNVKLVESNTTTVYFGSRKSQRYSRLYEKVGKDRDAYKHNPSHFSSNRVIRFETEFKGKLAEVGWKSIKEGTDDSLLLVYGEIGKKWVSSGIMTAFLGCLESAARGVESYQLRGERKNTDPYNFFCQTILPWLRKRHEKVTGSELENIEQWIQSHFLDD